ncbi:DUF397 domain-containing protein [Actinomadura sp. 3N508]|uniref:DUF397 domain-containing protein n=1 Tax=Actinomadura sp. 3N508 TaxID=3375153 RepID=UPI00378E5786
MPTLENPRNNSEQPAHGLRWRKSRACDGNESCVETARRPDTIVVRDNAAPGTDPVLDFSPREWEAFLQKTKRGAYDL